VKGKFNRTVQYFPLAGPGQPVDSRGETRLRHTCHGSLVPRREQIVPGRGCPAWARIFKASLAGYLSCRRGIEDLGMGGAETHETQISP
jgi:hypothetical protein